MDKTDSGSDCSITPVPLSILRIRQFSTFPPALKQEVEPIETGGESRSWFVINQFKPYWFNQRGGRRKAFLDAATEYGAINLTHPATMQELECAAPPKEEEGARAGSRCKSDA